MKRTEMFLRCVNIFALTGYVMNVVGLLATWYNDLAKVNGVFHLFLVVFLLTLEIQETAPNMKYMMFMSHAFGRGVFYVWISMIMLNNSVVSIIGTSFTGVVGCMYILAGIFQACRKPRDSNNVVLVNSTPISSTYAINIEPDVPPTAGESSSGVVPDLPSYTKTDPYKK